MTNPTITPTEAVAWLEDPATLANKRNRADLNRAVWFSPMFTLKHCGDSGESMSIDSDDYTDPMRWWL